MLTVNKNKGLVTILKSFFLDSSLECVGLLNGLLRLPHRSNRNCYSRSSVRRCQHVAASIKNAAWIDHQARRMDFAGNHSLCLNLDPAFREDHSIKAAGDYHAVAFDLSLDLGAFSQNDRLFRNYISFDVSVDSKRPGQLERAFEGDALIDEPCPFFTRAILRGSGPLPCHDFSPVATLLL